MYLKSNRRAIAFAVGCVRLTLVNNMRRGAMIFSTAKEPQNECENALAVQFRASHKHQGTQYVP